KGNAETGERRLDRRAEALHRGELGKLRRSVRRFEAAVGGAGVEVGRVAVVALLAARDHEVPAACGPTVAVTAVTVGGIAVVALFAARDDAVPATGGLAVVVASVAVRRIAVVTGLEGAPDGLGVAAGGRRAA